MIVGMRKGQAMVLSIFDMMDQGITDGFERLYMLGLLSVEVSNKRKVSLRDILVF